MRTKGLEVLIDVENEDDWLRTERLRSFCQRKEFKILEMVVLTNNKFGVCTWQLMAKTTCTSLMLPYWFNALLFPNICWFLLTSPTISNYCFIFLFKIYPNFMNQGKNNLTLKPFLITSVHWGYFLLCPIMNIWYSMCSP